MTDIEEITWETFDERTRIWMLVLSNIPVEAIVRMLRLDLNTGIVTLRGVGRDKALGVIVPDEGREYFTPLRGWIRRAGACASTWPAGPPKSRRPASGPSCS